MSELTQEVSDNRLTEEFLADLHEYVEQAEVKELAINIEDTSFKITSKEQANFFIRKLNEAREERDAVNAAAASEITRLTTKVNAWQEKEVTKCNNAEAYFMNLLEQFAAEELKDSDKKSLKLPFGTLSFKKQQDKYEYDDEVLLKCLKDGKMTDYIQIKEAPKKAELKKVGTVKDNKLYLGNVEIKGVTVTEQDAKFDVK